VRKPVRHPFDGKPVGGLPVDVVESDNGTHSSFPSTDGS
jgi:hypothetical protein